MHSKLKSRPIQVGIAIWILYGSLALSSVDYMINAVEILSRYTLPTSLMVFLLLAFAIPLVLMWGIIFLMSRGDNWARVIYFVLALLTIAFSLPSLFEAITTAGRSPVMEIVGLSVGVSIIMILFGREASEWFLERRVFPVESPLRPYEFIIEHGKTPHVLDNNGAGRRTR